MGRYRWNVEILTRNQPANWFATDYNEGNWTFAHVITDPDSAWPNDFPAEANAEWIWSPSYKVESGQAFDSPVYFRNIIEVQDDSLELVGPYDYDYFYLNSNDNHIVKYYPEFDITEYVEQTSNQYFDIANKSDDLYGIRGGKLYNLNNEGNALADLTNNSLTYNNGYFYYMSGTTLRAYDPVSTDDIEVVDTGASSRGDLVALNGDMYYLGAHGTGSQIIKVDFNNNYNVSTVGTYAIADMFGIATANDDLYVAYGDTVSKVNLSDGSFN